MFYCFQYMLCIRPWAQVLPRVVEAMHVTSEQQCTGKSGEFGALVTAGGKQCCRNESNPFSDYSQIYAIHFSFWYPVSDHVKL